MEDAAIICHANRQESGFKRWETFPHWHAHVHPSGNEKLEPVCSANAA